jgi:hypothetical protein
MDPSEMGDQRLKISFVKIAAKTTRERDPEKVILSKESG